MHSIRECIKQNIYHIGEVIFCLQAWDSIAEALRIYTIYINRALNQHSFSKTTTNDILSNVVASYRTIVVAQRCLIQPALTVMIDVNSRRFMLIGMCKLEIYIWRRCFRFWISRKWMLMDCGNLIQTLHNSTITDAISIIQASKNWANMTLATSGQLHSLFHKYMIWYLWNKLAG